MSSFTTNYTQAKQLGNATTRRELKSWVNYMYFSFLSIIQESRGARPRRDVIFAIKIGMKILRIHALGESLQLSGFSRSTPDIIVRIDSAKDFRDDSDSQRLTEILDGTVTIDD